MDGMGVQVEMFGLEIEFVHRDGAVPLLIHFT